MIEHIKTTVSNHNGSVTYWIPDLERGVPYATLTVLSSGDYYCKVYGSFCFKRPSHDKLIKYAKPKGKDITAQEYFKNK